jgi:hypothetical protein
MYNVCVQSIPLALAYIPRLKNREKIKPTPVRFSSGLSGANSVNFVVDSRFLLIITTKSLLCGLFCPYFP